MMHYKRWLCLFWNRLTAPARIKKLAQLDHARLAQTENVSKRRRTAKDWVRVGERHPGVGQARAIEDVERLEDSDEQRDAGDCILIESAARGILLERVERAG